MQAKSVVDRAAAILQDEGYKRWSQDLLLDFLNEGRRQLVSLRPDAAPKTTTVKLDPGTRQSLPSDGRALIDVRRNMGSDGKTPGEAITFVGRRALDVANRSWHAQRGDDQVDHYTTVEGELRTFYVTPPVTSDTDVHVELVYQASPADLQAVTDDLGTDSAYDAVLADWVLYRAFSVDTSEGSANRAGRYYEQFYTQLGAHARVGPRARRQPRQEDDE